MHTVAVTDLKQLLPHELCSTVADHTVALHLTKPEAAIPAPAFYWLAHQYLEWAACTAVYLVVHHVLEALVEGGAEEDLGFELASGVAVVQHLPAALLVAAEVEGLGDVLYGDVGERCGDAEDADAAADFAEEALQARDRQIVRER